MARSVEGKLYQKAAYDVHQQQCRRCRQRNCCTHRQVLLHHASSAHIGCISLQATGGDDNPLGIIPNLQSPLPGSAGAVQPSICVLQVAALLVLLLQGVPQQQLGITLSLQDRKTGYGYC